MTFTSRTTFDAAYPVIECLVLLIGVIPPFVDATFNKGNLVLPDGEDSTQSNIAPIDVLGVLMFYARLPLLFKWWVTSFVMSSQSYIAWMYNVQVGPTFRFKYLFTQYPVRIIVLSLLTAWAAGTYSLRAFEYDMNNPGDSVHQLQTWAFVSYGYITASEIGGAQPISVFGQITASLLALVGILNIAALTAMFCGGTELDGREVWLITEIEKRNRIRQMTKRAARLLQRRFRLYRVLNRTEGVPEAFRRLGSHAELTVKESVKKVFGEPRPKLFNSVAKAERHFKSQRLKQSTMDVTNIKTVHSLVLRLNERMGALEDMVREVHKDSRTRAREESFSFKRMAASQSGSLDAVSMASSESEAA